MTKTTNTLLQIVLWLMLSPFILLLIVTGVGKVLLIVGLMIAIPSAIIIGLMRALTKDKT